MNTGGLMFIGGTMTYLIIWMKAFPKTQLEYFRDIITSSEMNWKQSLSYKSDRRSTTTLQLVCCPYVKCLTGHYSIVMAPRFCRFHNFDFTIRYWQTRIIATVVLETVGAPAWVLLSAEIILQGLIISKLSHELGKHDLKLWPMCDT